MKKLFIIGSVLLMLVVLLPLMGAAATKSLVIEVSQDAYIIADINDAEDSYGYRDINYGTQDFVATWYYWNVEEQEVAVEDEAEGEEEEAVGDETEGEETEGEGAETEGEETEGEEAEGEETEGEEAGTEVVEVEKEKIISVVYLKFDLSQIEGKEIDSAMLQLYPTEISLLSPRYVQAYLVSSEWEEATLTYNTAPAWGDTALATTTIYQAGQWYGWDVSDNVVSAAEEGQVSLAVMFRDMEKASEELVVFSSHESGENVPRLLITYTESGFSWYWWLIGGAALLVLLAAAFYFGLKLMQRRQQPAETKA